ncbi:hypothetical protein [Sinorhizobium sp. RAC02]|uniref:hypothetical protein n=1 Tax=Sinorhizobium sp. RAC02 TaxID=1842534 RepID=UPI00085806E7|nr:hypothetical protein [Sinorhizobium sp. RAC02]AOF89219.1 hypothetical protein BSY16_1142 [Sinorhizobium sp. RAC02]
MLITEVPFVLSSPRRRVMEIRDGRKRNELKFDGRLALSIWGVRPKGIRSEWKDEPHTKIETSIFEIITNCQLILASQKAYDNEVKEEQRQRLHMEHRRDLAKGRNTRDDERKAFIRRVSQVKLEIDDVRNVLALSQSAFDTAPDFKRMLEWARCHLIQLEEEATIRYLQQSLVNKDLFPDPDPSADSPVHAVRVNIRLGEIE